MRYLVSYDSTQGPTDKIRKELAGLRADPFHRWAWSLESALSTGQLLQYLNRFLDGADGLVVVDVTDRDVGVAHGPDRTLVPEIGSRQVDPGSVTHTSLAAASLAAEPAVAASAHTTADAAPVEATPPPAPPAPAEPSVAPEHRLAGEPEEPTS